MSNYGYYVFGRDMNNLNLKTLQGNRVTDLFLNFYAISLYGEGKVEKFIKSCKTYKINVHLWVQSFYNDDGWINPKTANLKNKLNEIKKYTKLTGLTGIHLDYLRYPGNAYKTGGGAEAITDFVRNVKKSLPKGMVLSCALMPEKEGKKYYGQDIEKLGKLVDFVVPMQYKGNYQSGTSWLKDTTKYFSKYANVWSALQSYKSDDNPVKLSSSELSNDVKTVMGNGAKGVVLFRYGLSPIINFKNNSAPVKTVSYNKVVELAETVKEYVETTKKFPTKITIGEKTYSYGEICYLLSYSICNLKKNPPIRTVKNNTSPKGDKVKGKILKEDYLDLTQRILKYIVTNGVLPNYASIRGKRLRPRDYIYALARILVYYKVNGKLANYVSVDTSIYK